MKRKLLARRPSAAMVVAVVALVSSLTGGAVAATLITGSDIAKNAIAKKHIKANAVRSGKVKNGTLLAKDFKAGQLPAGAVGPQGPQGIPGAKGDTGAAGANGTNGTNGTDGDDFTIATTLQSGQTQKGLWGGWGGSPVGNYLQDTVNFRVPLAAAIPSANVHYVGGANANCPGTSGDPLAAAGHMCVYQVSKGNATHVNTFNTLTGGNGISVYGFSIYFTVDAAGAAHAYGTWAVTAP